MIVSINNNNSDSYLNLFTDAYKFLKAIDEAQGTSYVDPDKERFSSLAEYYGHIADLFETAAYQYIMVPVDEEPFKIDLNKREITVPASFSKCASVQTDLLAETIIFTTDRYFDYMDLATTEIYVQWITPGPEGIHGATRVEMIDRSQDNKLKFAWPLNDIITKVPGDVKFSVRFFRLDKNSSEVVYNLNTLENKITILPAMQPNGPSIVERPVSSNLFTKAIINSYYSSEGIPEPQTPGFNEPGSDITINPDKNELLVEDDNKIINGVKVVGLKNNTITLYAQATVADAGEIRYEWYHRPDGSDVFYPCAAFPVEDSEDTIVFGTVADEYIEVREEDKQVRVPHERYYIKDGNGWVLYTGEFPTEETLYTKFSAYTVDKDSENIVGDYHVRAYNEIVKPNSSEIITSSRYGASIDCLLPAPQEINITTDLNKGKILTSASEAALSIEVADDVYGPAITYEWRKSTTGEDNITEVELSGDEASYTATEPGWYQARIISCLNRKEKEEFSKVCKVTNKPLPPVVVKQGEEQLNTNDTGEVKLHIVASLSNENNIAEGLLSDKLHYIWQMRPINIDKDWTTISDNDPGISGQGTSTLTVTKEMEYGAASFRCLVINELNGLKAVFDHSGEYWKNVDPSLGEFRNEPPFIGNTKYVYIVLNQR